MPKPEAEQERTSDRKTFSDRMLYPYSMTFDNRWFIVFVPGAVVTEQVEAAYR